MSDEFERKDTDVEENVEVEQDVASHNQVEEDDVSVGDTVNRIDSEKNGPQMKVQNKGSMFRFMNGQFRLPTVNTKEEARKLFFRQNSEYYMNYFEKFQKTGKKISWNWCAFLFNPAWFFSRKMYLFGVLDCFIFSLYSYGAYNMMEYIEDPRIQAMVIPWSLLFLAITIGFGMFGNYLYISHMENKVVYPGEHNFNGEQVAQINYMRGGFSYYGLVLCFCFSNIILFIVEELAMMV